MLFLSQKRKNSKKKHGVKKGVNCGAFASKQEMRSLWKPQICLHMLSRCRRNKKMIFILCGTLLKLFKMVCWSDFRKSSHWGKPYVNPMGGGRGRSNSGCDKKRLNFTNFLLENKKWGLSRILAMITKHPKLIFRKKKLKKMCAEPGAKWRQMAKKPWFLVQKGHCAASTGVKTDQNHWKMDENCLYDQDEVPPEQF